MASRRKESQINPSDHKQQHQRKLAIMIFAVDFYYYSNYDRTDDFIILLWRPRLELLGPISVHDISTVIVKASLRQTGFWLEIVTFQLEQNTMLRSTTNRRRLSHHSAVMFRIIVLSCFSLIPFSKRKDYTDHPHQFCG
jgi:hypothetical protein